MKIRLRKTARSAARRRFAFHPLAFAICVGLSGGAMALPKGGKVVSGEATINQPNGTTEVIRQTTDKAIIDWLSFSIAAGEKVRFYQPSSTSVTLNRVTGYDPSFILGQMSSNGKIFLLNPYGVVFGAGARIDVGGLVASTLSMSDNDFLASRYSLTSVDPKAPAQRGVVRNEGTISAPGGTVVLAGPDVSNTGTIVANGGRVGLVAANSVSVDVEGDGLLFFQTTATDARNRLSQLGHIQADGGTVEMRAAARGAFADTVLNMGGVVQARSIGKRDGRIVIDGGDDGITAVSGRLEATGLAAGERGGSVTVQGQRVLLADGAMVDASGSAGGGQVRIGGDFHGSNPDVRNAEITGVAAGATVRADAIDSGDGGKVAIWADGTTRFYGKVSAEGGKSGGDGGFVEVSGKQTLVFDGDVSTRAPSGKAGTLLLDPANIVIAAAVSSVDDAELDAGVPVGQGAGIIAVGDSGVTTTISTTKLELIAKSNDIDLNASNSITIDPLLAGVGTANTLTFDKTAAGGSVAFHSGAGGFSMRTTDSIVVTNGSLTIDSGTGTVNVGSLQAKNGVTLSGSGVTLNGSVQVTAAGAGVSITGPTTLAGTAGAITLTGSNAANDVTLGAVNGAKALVITAGGGDIVLGAAGATTALTSITLSGNTASVGPATTVGAQDYSGVATTTLKGTLTVNTAGAGVSAGNTALAAGGGTIALTGTNAGNDVTLGTVDGARPLVITANGGDIVLGAVGGATALSSVTLTGTTAGLQAVTTSGAQSYGAVGTTTLNGTLTVNTAGAGVTAGATALAAGGGAITLTGTNAANDVTLGAVNGAQTLAVTAGGGDIVLGAVGGTTPLAGVTLSGNTASLLAVTTSGAQDYGSVGTTTLGGTLTVNAAGAGVTAGAVALAAGGGTITLTGTDVANDVSLGTVTGARALTITAGGGDVTLGTAGATPLTSVAITAGTADLQAVTTSGAQDYSGVGTTTLHGTLTVNTAGAGVTAGATQLAAGGGTIALTGTNAGNDVTLGTVNGAATLDVTANGGTVSLGTVGATTALTGVSITATAASIGDVRTAGNQTYAAAVGAGVVTLDAGTGAIAASNAGNDFTGTVTLKGGGSVSIRDTNDLDLASPTLATNTTLTAVAGGTLTLPAGAIALGTGNLDLQSNGGALATAGDLSGNNLSLTGRDGITLGSNLTAAGTVSLTTTNSAITQSAGKTIDATSATTFAAGTGAVTLGQNNLFSSIGGTGGTVTLVEASANGVVLDPITAASLSVDTSASNGAVTQSAGSVAVTNATVINAGSGDITLANATNNFSNGAGNSFTGGAISLHDADNLTVTTLAPAANRAVTVVAGGSLSLPAGGISTGNADLNLSALGGALSTPGDLSGRNITLTGSAGLALSGNLVATGTVDLNTTNTAITQSAGKTIDASGVTTFNAGTGNVTLGQNNVFSSVGGTGGAVTLFEASANGVVLNPITAASLTVNTSAGNGNVTQSAGAVVVSGATVVNAGSGDITLANTTNNFSNGAGNSFTGGAISLRDTNDLTVTTLAPTANHSLTVVAGGALTLAAGAIDTGNADIDLRALGAALTTPGDLSGRNIALTGAAGLSLASNLTATGNVSLNSTNATISQAAGKIIDAAGATTFSAGTGAVTLGQNNLFGSIGGTAGAVTLVEASAGGVALDTMNVASLNVSTNNGAVTQTALQTLTVGGATTINAGTAAVTLANGGNNFTSFGGTGSAVSVADVNGIVLNAVSAGTLLVDTSAGGGAVTQSGAPLTITGATTINAGVGGGSINLNAANQLGSFGATGSSVNLVEASAGGVALDNVVAGSLTVATTNANVVQSSGKTIVVSGATAIAAGTGSVTLANNGNNFGSVGAVGGAVSIKDVNALALDAINASSLTVDTSAGNGALTQNAALVVSGATVVNTGTGAITLANAGNNFSNLAGNSFTGGAISLRDADDLTVTTLSAGTNQAVSVVAGGSLSLPAGGIATGTADLTLASGLLLTTPGPLSGNNVALSGTAGILVGADVTASGTLSLSTTNAAVTQTAGSIVAAGPTTVTAGTGTVSLGLANDFGAINVVSGGAVTVNDVNALTVTANASGTLTVTSTGPLSSGGTIAGANVALTGNAGINLANNVNTAGTLQLSSSNAAITQSAGALNVGGTTTVTAGSGDITLNQAGNDFHGVLASGGAVRLRDTNALDILGLVNGANKDLSLTAGTTITGVTGNIDTGSADLTISAGNGFTTFGTLRGTNVTLGGGIGGISIGHNLTALGNLALTTTNAAVTQTAGGIVVTGTTTANAGTGAINLGLAGNNFATFAATGSNVAVRDDNGLTLGVVSATTLAVDTSAGNGAVTQSGAASVSGATTITSGSGAVTLGNTANTFGSIGVAGGAVTIVDAGALALNAISASSLTLNTSAVNGNITQNAAAVVSGATTVDAGTGNVSLTNINNDFGSIAARGTAVTVADVNGIALGAVNAGTLSLTAGGAVTQNAAAVVSGATVVNAGGNAVTLGNAANNFSSIGVTGGAVTITDLNALALDAINASSLTIATAAGNGNVSQNAAALVTGATSVNAGTGSVALVNAGNNFGSVAATGGAVSITDINALTLGAIAASSLSVNTAAGNGAVTQSGAAIVGGTTTVNAGSGAVALTNAGNDFATLGLTGGALSVVDANALTLSSLSSAANQAVSIAAGGTLTLPATAIDTGTASLTLSSGGPLTTVGTLRGTNVALASAGTMVLANNVTALGTLGLTTTNAAIQQTGGTIAATGATTVNAGSGDITLAQASNNFQGAVGLSGGAVSVRDIDNLAVGSLVSGANRPVSLIAGGSLTLPAGAIDTGTADLTLQALGGSLVINSALNGNNVTLTGTAGLTLGANVTSSGAQVYTTAVQLSGNVTLDAGASKIDLQGGANGGGNNLSLKSTNAAADAVRTGPGAAIANTAQFSVAGNSTLGGNVTTTGNQTYSGLVTLDSNLPPGSTVTLASGASKIDLQAGVDATGHALALTSSNAAADAVRAGGAISNASQLAVTGKSTLASGVATTGSQTYTDTVSLGSASDFSGSSLSFGNGILAGAFDLGLRSDALTLNGAVTGTGNATLSSVTAGTSVGIAGGAGTYQISQATLDKFSTFSSITVGRADGTGDVTVGNVVLPTDLTVKSGSGDVDFTGTVGSAAGLGRSLGVASGGVTTFSGAVGGAIGGPSVLGTLTVTGATALDASVTSNGSQTFGGPVTVGANATLSASAIAFGSSLDVGTRAMTLLTDAITIGSTAIGSGTGSVRIAPRNASGSMGIGGGTGALQISQGLVDAFAGVPTLALGRPDSTGTITVGTLVLPTDLAISNGSGNVALTGSVDSAAGPARDLTVATTGTTSIGGAIGTTRALDTLTVTGASAIGADVVTSGAQSYAGPATLTADTTLTGPTVAFGSTVDGAKALTVNATSTVFGGAVGGTTALTSLATDAAGTTQLGGSVTTTGSQSYADALRLNADTTLTGTTLTLGGTVDGAQTLALNGSTGVTLGGAIGVGTALAGLSVTGPLQLDAGTVTTTGAQSYGGKTVLGAATTLTAPSIAFGNTLDGPFSFTVQSAGPTSFGGAVGATAALASLTASGGGTVQLAAPSIDTTGAQSYSGALQLAGTTRLTGSALTLTGAVTGATDLTLQTNALSGATSLAGTGVLTISSLDPTLSIGVAGGAGALQVSQAVLDGASGFTGQTIGRSDGSGTITAGNLVLRADTTLQTSTGNIDLGGSVDGGFALALNSGGTTRIAGPVGTTTALKSLTTDNNAAAADWNGTAGERTLFDTADGTGSARIVTTGAQTYADPVTATVPVNFVGGAITATQASNRFDGTVGATATSLDLRNSSDLLLGTITLQNGGSLETDRILHLTGALQLNGGTLVLKSNWTPVPIELTDEFTGKTLSFGFVPIKEASATIVQESGATLGSAAGSLIAFRSPAGGSIKLDGPGNNLLGDISAVSGKLGDNDLSRFSNASSIMLSFIRIASTEIHVSGRPPTDGDQNLVQAGLEADAIKLTADTLTTGTSGLIRARLPFNNVQGSQTSVPGLTFVLTPGALAKSGSFGAPSSDNFVQVQVGGSEGGFITALPKGTSGDTAVIFLGGNGDVRPFYDGTGKLTEIRIFYNGDAPRTPQEAGALAAVIGLIEEARHARFEEAVRTENVSSRLRSGVIAEVGAGRPATVGRESIRLPDTCEIKPKSLQCE